MSKQRVFLTGASGTMGLVGMQALLEDADQVDLVVLLRPSEKNKKLMGPLADRVEVVWGDLTCHSDVVQCVRNCDVVLHVGALVSPRADDHPRQAMAVNYGGTVSIIQAIHELKQQHHTSLVYIGTVAQTGDRMPPIHWGRVGDPLKPSVFDYYAVSKIAAERAVVHSGLDRWVSLRQTGIMGPAMAAIEDPIMFHNGLDNVLEYVSDRDSARLLRNLCREERRKALDDTFWGHIFNVGGGESCRASTYHLYQRIFAEIGVKNLALATDAKWYATRNFHGQYYLDSDDLENRLHFRRDNLDYFYQSYIGDIGAAATAAKIITRLPGGQRLVGSIMKKRFLKAARAPRGTVHFIEQHMAGEIAAYWGSEQAWRDIPPLEQFHHFTDWDTVVPIDHGYDENQPEHQLSLEDMRQAAAFRGGVCLSSDMERGNWNRSLSFECCFGHRFEGTPRLILEGGHWCPVCERESWNYYQRAKHDDFFAQIWWPLHPKDEPEWTYPKSVSELDVAPQV